MEQVKLKPSEPETQKKVAGNFMEGAMPKQSLRSAANLALPPVQVVVMRANMGCNHCRHRVSQVASKMNGLLDYVVDIRKKEVVLRGIVDIKKRKAPKMFPKHKSRQKFPRSLWHFKFLRCFGSSN